MPRPRKFDQHQVLAQVVETFWQQGFAATSTAHLERASGIRRGSLYNAYKDKRGLFEAALVHYAVEEMQAIQALLQQAEDLPAAVSAVMQRAIDVGRAHTPYRGCLLCDTALELGARMPELASQVRKLFAPMADALLARTDAQLPTTARQALVDLIMTTYMGLRTQIKLGVPESQCQALVARFVATLG